MSTPRRKWAPSLRDVAAVAAIGLHKPLVPFVEQLPRDKSENEKQSEKK